MSQTRKPRTRSRRGSSEGDAENCSEALLPETVIEAARKSGRRRVVPFKLRNSEEYVSEPESLSSSELELDDLIDDFGDDELEYSESAEEVTQPGMDTVNEEYSHLELKLFEGSDDEEAKSERDGDWSIAAYMRPKKQKPEEGLTKNLKSFAANSWKYGKLWQFIRDLLKNEKYNPNVIRWVD